MSTRSCFHTASTDLDRKGRDRGPGRREPFLNPLCGVARSVHRSYYHSAVPHTHTHTHKPVSLASFIVLAPHFRLPAGPLDYSI